MDPAIDTLKLVYFKKNLISVVIERGLKMVGALVLSFYFYSQNLSSNKLKYSFTYLAFFIYFFSIFLNFCVCASLCSCTYLPLSICRGQRTPWFSPSRMRVTNIEHRSLVLVTNPFSHWDTMMVSFGQLDTNQSHLRGRTTNEEIFSTVWPVGIYRESIFFAKLWMLLGLAS